MTPRPNLGSSAEELYERLRPFQQHSLEGRVATDEELGWPLLLYWGFLARIGMQELSDIVSEAEGSPGYSLILNIERIPAKGLPWLTQLAGVRLLPGMEEREQRTRIRSTDGLKRGTPLALAAAAQRHLTGEKVVILQERFGGDAKRLGVVTYRRETPSPELTRQDIEEQLPWWIKLEYNIEEAWDFAALRVEQATFAAIGEHYRDYRELREHVRR